jgi:hypothetical protein
MKYGAGGAATPFTGSLLDSRTSMMISATDSTRPEHSVHWNASRLITSTGTLQPKESMQCGSCS